MYKRPAWPHLICSLFNSEVSLCFVHGRVTFYYFKILANFTCKRIRANVGLTRNLCGQKFIFLNISKPLMQVIGRILYQI